MFQARIVNRYTERDKYVVSLGGDTRTYSERAADEMR